MPAFAFKKSALVQLSAASKMVCGVRMDAVIKLREHAGCGPREVRLSDARLSINTCSDTLKSHFSFASMLTEPTRRSEVS
jgi:hypothetical protein